MNNQQEETSSTISEIKEQMIEKKKKVGGESASYKLQQYCLLFWNVFVIVTLEKILVSVLYRFYTQ